MKKRILLLLFAVLFLAAPGFALEEDDDIDQYEQNLGLGDQIFAINAGLFIPLFYMDTKANIEDTNLKLGGVGSLVWQSFLTNHISLGAELAGMFSFTPNDRVLYMVPLTAKASYWFRFGRLEIPVSLGIGGCYCSLDDSRHIDFIVKPAVSFYWDFNDEWVFGLNAAYWFIPQIYTGSGKVSKDDTMFGNFLETSLCVLFRF